MKLCLRILAVAVLVTACCMCTACSSHETDRTQKDAGALPTGRISEEAGQEVMEEDSGAQDMEADVPAGSEVPDVTGPDGSEECDPAEHDEDVPAVDVPRHVIVLDPGHGGCYPGAEYNGRIEKELTLTVAGYVRDYLLENYSGVDVYLTRESDTALSSNLVEDLELRAEFAAQSGADALVSIHFNAADSHNHYGATVYVSNRAHVNPESSDLASEILGRLTALGLDDNGVQTRNSNDMVDDEGKPLDYYAINRHCAARNIPGIIVEHCFIDNPIDEPYLCDDNALKRLAKADAEGIAQYYGLIAK